MADNYLGNKMEEHLAKSGKPTGKLSPSLSQLIARNRSCRGFDASYRVSEDHLRRMVAVCNKIPSARNQQVLRYRLVCGEEAARIAPLIRLGGALPELHLPLPGTEPNAFIAICSTEEESRYVDMDLGIAAQSILLKAVEMGFNGICIGAFDKEAVCRELHLALQPLLLLAVGKSAEQIEMVEVAQGDSLRYYRKDGVHYVPKIKLEDLIIK